MRRDERSVAFGAVLGPDARGVAVRVSVERLLAAVDKADRQARPEREQRAVQLHREVLTSAERASDAAEVSFLDPSTVELAFDHEKIVADALSGDAPPTY